jgi:hypothetical protein
MSIPIIVAAIVEKRRREKKIAEKIAEKKIGKKTEKKVKKAEKFLLRKGTKISAHTLSLRSGCTWRTCRNYLNSQAKISYENFYCRSVPRSELSP